MATNPSARLTDKEVTAFRRKIFAFYRRYGRQLPFRETADPYCITVAELMLQQTQVERVIEKYRQWLERWPDWQALAQASRRDLLAMWSGLGYNRRALYLGEMARCIVDEYDGVMPQEPEQLVRLPGIGPYTAHAIAIFAFNKPVITIDTNIRKVLIHEFGLPHDISRAELERLAYRLLPRRRSRDWHNALMDYCRIAIKEAARTIAPLSRQSKFAGSQRQIRGEIVRQLTTKKRVALARVAEQMGRTIADVRTAAQSLERDGVVIVTAKTVRLA
ncbi:Fe-S cluster assembly protein HesB [candidate division GN15 bacterium]|nr:Fe-S cluster assembly protein HesB [candidate division GN15 bacterium]